MVEAAKPLYFDHAATTPLLPVARDAMLACYDAGPANAHASHHQFGWHAKKQVEDANRLIMQGLGLSPLNAGLVWTSGATEANNLALTGLIRQPGAAQRLVIGPTEHASITAPAQKLQQQGIDVQILGCDNHGQISLKELEQALQQPTALVSIMAANNETGILHPVDDIARICRGADVIFHCDASQCLRFGPDYLPSGADLITLSGHKAGGPGGIGVLAWQDTAPAPLVYGGGQQSGLRPGTLPVALINGFAAAFQHALTIDNWQLQDACQRFERHLLEDFPELEILGKDLPRLPGFTALAGDRFRAEDIFDACPDLAMSTGSACASEQTGPSVVLKAMGVPDKLAAGSLRLTGGHDRPSWHYELATAQLLGAFAEFYD